MHRISRRQFISNLSLAAAAGMLPKSGLAAGERVVVVGAGLSGLYAARLLEARGFEVIVLEARNRVGGRVLSLDALPGHPEAGANIIGPNYGRVIDQAKQLNVPLEMPARGGASGLVINDQRVTREAWPASDLNPLPESLTAVAPDRLRGALLKDNPVTSSIAWRSPELARYDISAAEHFRSMGLDDRALQLLDVNNSYGNRLQDTSLLTLYRVSAGISRAIAMRQPVFQVTGGNMRLPEALAASLINPPRLGETVREIRQTKSSVRVMCESGTDFDAAFVICALPATAVRKIVLSPALPEKQADAFGSVEYHKITQAHLLAEEPFWEDSGDPASWWTNGPLGRIFTSPTPNESGGFNITVWINGDGCNRFDAMGEEAAGQFILEHLNQMAPASRGVVSVGTVKSWALDPFNEGTWAVWRPGQIASLPGFLQQAYGRIFFAGEHLAVSNSGLEGAMESGEQAAIDVMRKLA